MPLPQPSGACPFALLTLLPSDKILIAGATAGPGIGRHLEVLIGLLRLGTQTQGGALLRVCIPRAPLNKITGGRRVPTRVMQGLYVHQQRHRVAYRLLREAAKS